MPDFDNLGNPIIRPTTSQPFDLTNPASKEVPIPYTGIPLVNENTNTPQDNSGDVFDMLSSISKKSKPTGGVFVTNKELEDNRRYDYYNPTVDNYEDFAANGQSAIDKAKNGVLKGVNLAATTVLGGFAMVGGAARAALPGGKMSDIWDNPATRALDDWNTRVDNEYLPNYQTDAEKNAAWYQKDYWMTTNFLFDTLIKNSGFAVGAMISGNIASSVLKAAGSGLGVLATEAAIGAEASQAFKAFTPLLRNTARAFSSAKNIEAAAILEKEITSIIDLESRVSQLAAIAKQTNTYAKIGDKVHRSIIAAYSSAGEASFEALATAKEYRNNLIEQYKNEHYGAEPPADVLKNINNTAESLGKTSFFGNLALLGLTEYAQLPKLIGSTYAAEKQAANSLLGMAEDVIIKDGKYVRVGADASKLAKGLQTTQRRLGYIFDPKEGAQELGQYALQVGSTNYYDKAFEGKEANAWTDGFLYGLTGVNERGEDVGALTSKEGIIGGITGALTGGIMSAKSEFKQHKSIQSNTDRLIDQLNNAPVFRDSFKDRLNHANRAVALQQEQEAATLAGDKLQAKDLNADLMHNYLAPRIKYGRFDMVMADINDMKMEAMTKDGLPALKEQGYASKNDTVESFTNRLDNFQRVANETNEIYKSHDLRYSGQVLTNSEGDIIRDSAGNPTRKYSPEIIDKLVYASSKIVDYDYRIPQVSIKLLSSNIDTTTIAKDYLNKDFDSYNKAIADINAMDIRVEEKTELLEDLKDVVDLTQRRDKFLKEYQSIVDKPKLYEYVPEPESESEEEIEKGTKISVKTKDGVRDIEIGVEYALGKVTEYSKTGKQVFRQPRLTVLGKNADGTIKIKTSGGVIKDISEEVLEDYNLVPEERMQEKKYKFFEAHQNDVYIHRNIKIDKEFEENGKKVIRKVPAEGRLIYSGKDNTLLFQYIDSDGVVKTREVYNTMFVIPEGSKYKQPMVERIGTLEKDDAETARRKQIATDEFIAEVDKTVEARNKERLAILEGLSEDVLKRYEKVVTLVEQKTKQIANIQEDLNKLSQDISKGEVDNRYKKTVKFKKSVNKALDSYQTLSRTLEQLKISRASLEAEQEELEYTHDYIESMMQDLDSLPVGYKDLLKKLEEDVKLTQDAITTNAKSISAIDQAIKALEKVLEDAKDLIKSLFNAFRTHNPNILTPTGEDWGEYLDTAPVFTYNKDASVAESNEQVAQLKDYLAFIEDTEVDVSKSKINDLQESLGYLSDKFDKLDKELTAQDVVYQKFKAIDEAYRASKVQEKATATNPELQKELIGTNDNSQQNTIKEGNYQPNARKDKTLVVRSSIVPGNLTKDYQIRTDRFANRFDSLPNKDQIKAVILTTKNEGDLVSGLIQSITLDEAGDPMRDINIDNTIAMVFVRETDKGPVLVNEQGEDIDPELSDEAKLNLAVYQAMPDEELVGYYPDTDPTKKTTMFRAGTTKEDEAAGRKFYKEWRDAHLQDDATAIGPAESVRPSKGIMEYVTKPDENGKQQRQYDARIPVTDNKGGSALISEYDLQETPVVMVGINDEVSNATGTVVYNNAKGKVFLRTANDNIIPLNNRKFTSKEVDVMYDVILQAAKNATEHKTLKTGNTQELFDWLRSVAYWGTAVDQEGNRKPEAGYNNIWFDYDIDENGDKTVQLFISAKGYKVPFTENGLNSEKEVIKGMLKELYFNTRASLVNNTASEKSGNTAWDQTYYETIGINSEGEMIQRKWQNYQSFLLSPLVPNSRINKEGKPVDVPTTPRDIPLTTNVRPLLGEEDKNRKNFYFTLTDSIDDIYSTQTPVEQEIEEEEDVEEEETAEEKAARQARIAAELEAKRKAKQAQVTTSTGFHLDGKTPNVVNILNKEYLVVVDPSLITGEEPNDIMKGVSFVTPTGEERKMMSVLKSLSVSIAEVTKKAGKTLVYRTTLIDPFTQQQYEGEELEQVKKDIVALHTNLAKALVPKIKEALADTGTPEHTIKEEPIVETPVDNSEEANWKAPVRPKSTGRKRPEFRLAVKRQDKYKITSEKWGEVEKFIKQSFPNIPFYRVKNMIQATNGRQAYGMLKEGAIYVTEGAETGTAYHEVFEAVWKMVTPFKERVAIIKEFRSREGVFEDRETGRIIKYSEATDHQVKEQLAEEFRAYVLSGKAKGKSFLHRMFDDLINMIKTFFSGRDAQYNTNQLFERIGNGYYRQFNPYESQLSYANSGIINIEDAEGGPMDEYRIEDIPIAQLNEIIQQMTFTTVNDAIQDNRSLFRVVPKNKEKFYKRLYDDIHITIDGEIVDYTHFRDTDTEPDPKKKELNTEYYNKQIAKYEKLADDVDANWGDIVRKHMNHLKAYNVTFDEVDEENITRSDRRKDDAYGDARQIDTYRKATPAVKLFLNTIPEVEIEDGIPQAKLSSIGGVILYPGDKMFITLMNGLHQSINLDDMLDKLRVMAMKDINYSPVYKRLTKTMPSANKVSVDYSLLKEKHDWDLIAAFWKTMKKQNSDVVTVFVLPSGETIVSDSTLSSAAKQSKRDMINSMIDSMRAIDKNPLKETKYFTYDAKTGKYNPTNTVKNYNLDPDKPETYVNFMKGIGVEFNLNTILNLKTTDPKKFSLFRESITNIKTSLAGVSNVVNISANTLNIEGRLFNLGVVKASIDNPEFESTYFNLNGDKTQTFLGTNILSSFYDAVSKLENLNDVLINPLYSQYKYLKTDVFTRGSSQILKKMFSERGLRKEGTDNIFKPVMVDGLVDEKSGDKIESSKLTSKQRVIQGMNLNLDGVFENLVPGDASIDTAVRMYDKGKEFVDKKGLSNKEHLNIFSEYFISEVELVRDNRRVASNKNSSDLRFFKDILSEATYAKVKPFMENKDNTPQMVYDEFEADINRDVESFFDAKTKKTIDLLDQYNIITIKEEEGEAPRIKLDSIELPTYAVMEDLEKDLKVLTVNYMISVIELHKLIYSDPYQYADELKRIKNFASPKQPLIVGSKNSRNSMHKAYNEGFEEGQNGWIDFNRDHFRTVTISDVLGFDTNLGYDNAYKETDGGGFITMKAYKVFRILAGSWSDANEAQYKHDMGYEDLVNSGATDLEVKEYEKKNPSVKDTYTPLKPIAAGNKDNGRSYNDIILHKYALVPLSFRINHLLSPTSNAIAMHDKMMREDIDYAVYDSGSKVGTEVVHDIYKDGRFNHDRFETPEQVADRSLPQGISKLPFSIMAVQSEVPSKDTPTVTQGSQITKLATMDFMEAGLPIDFLVKDKDGKTIEDFDQRYQAWINLGEDETAKENASKLYKEISNNQNILEEKIKEGYKVLLKKLGITEIITEDVEGNEVRAFNLKNTVKLVETLKDEVLKREINENIIEALEDLDREAVVIEATPVYAQIRTILFSIADKNVSSPKISGGQKVQITSRLLEDNAIVAHEKIIKGEKVNVYSSDILNFYSKENTEDGVKVNVCEVMLGRWFDSDMTDEELIDYLNNTKEGQKILNGVGFRIPTQKQNSIDVFKIKKFLPKEFGDSIVIPAALVNKAGSDFDIDKLSVYLKNVFEDLNGKPRPVPFFGIGEKGRQTFGNLFDTMLKKDQMFIAGKISSNVNLTQLLSDIASGKTTDKQTKKWLSIFREMYKDLIDENGVLDMEDVRLAFMSKLTSLGKRLEKLTDADIQAVLKEEFIDKMYMKSLENEYIESLERLISNPLNYDNLVKPNDASPLEKLSNKIQEKLGNEKIDYSKAGNMLDKTFMSSLRQAFVAGKYAIGIAATGQTGFAQRQRTLTYINVDNMKNIPVADREILGDNPKSQVFAKDSNINFENNYNQATIKGKKRPVFGMIKNKAGKYISDINGMFIDGYVDISKGPWIMLLGATPNVTSTWLFLVDLGVPIETIAYFINQPIIKDYLASVENSGYSWLFIEDLIKESLLKYAPKNAYNIKSIPSQDDLWNTIGMDVSEMKSDKLLSEQQYILKEFIKYAKLASHQFQVTQGSNFDTATLNDPFLILKKQMQYEKGKQTLISSIDDLTSASFIGVLRDTMYNVRDAMATILLSDRNNTTDGRLSIRKLMESVLMPYVEMSDREFVKTSQKAVADLFDWAMQTNPINDSISTYSDKVASTLLGSDTKDSSAQQIIEFKYKVLRNPDHPLFHNIVINALKIEKGNKGKPDNLSLTAKDGKAYNQDLIIGAFKELRQHLESMDSDLYRKLVRLAIMQSGLTNSPISFSQLLPYQDFKDVYFSSLSILERITDLNLYKELNVFQRNNWNNKNIVPQHKANMKYEKGERTKNYNEDNVSRRFSLAMNQKIIQKVINIRVGSPSGRNDFLVYSVEDTKVTPEDKKQMKKGGDYSYIKKYLMQKVYTIDENNIRVPLVQESKSGGTTYYNYVYKHINAWGDSFKAQEFYKEARESVLNNDFEKVFMKIDEATKAIVTGEADDNIITSILEVGTMTTEEVVASQRTAMEMQPDNIEKIKAGSKTTTLRASFAAAGDIRPNQAKIVNFGGEDFKVSHRGYLTILQAGGKPAIAKSEDFPTSPTATNKIPVEVDGKTYFVDYQKTADWMNGVGKIHVYDISSSEPVSVTFEEPDMSFGLTKEHFDDMFYSQKPESISNTEWENLTDEERNKIKEC